MKTNKLKLNDLKVKSFVTDMVKNEVETIKGGIVLLADCTTGGELTPGSDLCTATCPTKAHSCWSVCDNHGCW